MNPSPIEKKKRKKGAQGSRVPLRSSGSGKGSIEAVQCLGSVFRFHLLGLD